MGLFGIGNVAKIAGLAIAGLVGYTLIKNAGNIGSQFGSFAGTGLRNLGSGISEGFQGAFDIFGGSVNPDTAGATSENDPNVIIDMGTNPEDALIPSVGSIPISTPFKGFVSSGQISRDFAETYSHKPPAQPMASGIGHQLDVSSTFAYIGSEQYRNLSQASQANTNALARAIEDSANKYPEWFA